MNKWISWNKEGFFPGKLETEESFEKRVFFCKNLLIHLANKEEFKELLVAKISPEAKLSLEKACLLSEKFYGIKPMWVPLFFSNHQLAPWHGGCAWIFQLDEASPPAALLQLREHFSKNETYLKIYDRKELITHELSHVGRMAYEEPKYEEFFAYRSSTSLFRRWFGPLIQSSNETFIFILFLALTIFIDILNFSKGNNNLPFGEGIKWITFILFLFALMRAGIRHIYYHRCLNKVSQLLKKPEESEAFIYRLLDVEIEYFAKSPLNTIALVIQEKASKNFRWKFLTQIYPFKTHFLDRNEN